jgi:methyltransferase
MIATLLLAAVTLERLAELAWAGRNTRRLRAAGAYEAGAAHYPLIVVLHAAWLLGLWILGWNRPVEPVFLAFFLVVQVGRFWVLATLGARWTTRILVAPGEALVRHGPYRFMRHPNYFIVALEIALLPLALGLVTFAVVFSLANALVLALRIRTEDLALR